MYEYDHEMYRKCAKKPKNQKTIPISYCPNVQWPDNRVYCVCCCKHIACAIIVRACVSCPLTCVALCCEELYLFADAHDVVIVTYCRHARAALSIVHVVFRPSASSSFARRASAHSSRAKQSAFDRPTEYACSDAPQFDRPISVQHHQHQGAAVVQCCVFVCVCVFCVGVRVSTSCLHVASAIVSGIRLHWIKRAGASECVRICSYCLPFDSAVVQHVRYNPIGVESCDLCFHTDAAISIANDKIQRDL